MNRIEELLPPQRLKELKIVYACLLTRVPGEYFLSTFADGSRLRILDRCGADAGVWAVSALEHDRSLLSARIGGCVEVYARGVPFGMAESFLLGFKRRSAAARMFSAVFIAAFTIRELADELTPERGLLAELRFAPDNPVGYTLWLDGREFFSGR